MLVHFRTANNADPYEAEPVAIVEDLSRMGPAVQDQEIRVFTRNLAAALAVSQPRSQSGQSTMDQIDTQTKRLRVQQQSSKPHLDAGNNRGRVGTASQGSRSCIN